MDYDKNSFLAGIAVGQRLKGWAGSGALSMGGTGNGVMVIPVTSISLSIAQAVLVETPAVIPADYSEG